jgi:prolipoprotein diacylglyceryltransferase
VLAAIRLDFDPSTTVFGLSMRLETLALAGVILLALIVAALASGRVRVAAAPVDGVDVPDEPKLRRDDLILIAFGAVPGAVLGGRLGYALVHFDYYAANPKAVTDPGQGGFDLTLAVAVGTLTAIAVARLLAAPMGRWLSVASLPVLLGLGLGKLSMVLGGAGQGSYSDASWATSYAGSGPWGSANPSYPALPSQILEGGLVLAVAIGMILVPFLLRLRVRRWWRVIRPGLAPRREWFALSGGRRYMTALGMWAVVRFAAAFTWRDARVLGPFGADQLILVLVAAVAFVGQPAPGAVRRMRAAWVALRTARREARASKAALAAAAAQATAAEQAAAAAQAGVTTDATKAEQTLGAATEGSAAGTLSAPIDESEAAPDHTA